MHLKAVIVGPMEKGEEINKLAKRLWKETDVPFKTFKYLQVELEDGKTVTVAKKPREILSAMIAESDYLITFNKRAMCLEVREALNLKTQIILVTEAPYRHYYLDYGGTLNNPWRKVKWMRREQIPAFLENN